ncbi:MAG: sigma-54 dependent transcriptional regulator [Vicinamibacterales bacterium]|jgi:DNA-binding NtrC family response regulator|nr:DNA-binding response regulator [Acidobacteriota bacterium]MDP6371075.1 sigma-54 dependent transcriptional regulator [Vicinamibacterales bacterium]MDP6610573.1 sigma-54 dependent transcriptional regulator [Vicinamibacterales bacterium]HAK55433.1 DNA-binding response regulator [Acidobacteriota bacterium]
MEKARVLVVDDEDLIRWSLVERLAQEGYEMVEAATGQAGLDLCHEGVDLILLDYKLPDIDGLTILKRVRQSHPDALVILLTAYSTIDSAVEAIKLGAYHYLSKPFDIDEVVLLVQKALETTQLRREVGRLRDQEARPYQLDRIIGESPAMQEVKALLQKIATSPASTVLLTGESGTGKDLAAKVIHYTGDRAGRPFMNITCSALAETLLESELFGHERGAFTDARQMKRGLLESADHGTVFLDEISEMAASLQAKLLRFLEEKTFKRIGGSTDITVNVRIVAATNRNLDDAVKQGKFREDLYYRLNVLPVGLPTLRERSSDIPTLVKFFVDAFNAEFRKHVTQVTPDAMEALTRYPWPGNVRELRNAIERAMLLTDSEELGLEEFPMLATRLPLTQGVELPASGISLDQLERVLVAQALKRTKGNQTRAAALLGLNRDQIRYRIDKFKLERP